MQRLWWFAPPSALAVISAEPALAQGTSTFQAASGDGWPTWVWVVLAMVIMAAAFVAIFAGIKRRRSSRPARGRHYRSGDTGDQPYGSSGASFYAAGFDGGPPGCDGGGGASGTGAC